jgi:glucosamine--fructose-6-phosphate aminotransferase (isomerizing)
MCGIFGGFTDSSLDESALKNLAKCAQQRGRDSSGTIYAQDGNYNLIRSDFPLMQTMKITSMNGIRFLAGHSRLITNGFFDNQPIESDEIIVIHNGIILNTNEIWNFLNKSPSLEIDSEVLPNLASYFLKKGISIELVSENILSKCIGSISAVLIFPKLGKLVLFSNTGSLYIGEKNSSHYFASEQFPLKKINCIKIKKVTSGIVFDIPKNSSKINNYSVNQDRVNLIPKFVYNASESKLLHYSKYNLLRCNKCILPETMPFIEFDNSGVCNYCNNYVKRNYSKDSGDLKEVLNRYRYENKIDAIFPFSGGRDSTFGLHLAVNELGLKPITFTYDWGMVTDIGRRNISRICSTLGVENIVVAADIGWKRKNIKKNLTAWLKNPNLGMISILTAGDKHFFKHIETIKKQTGIDLNIWSINPLEVTHFKSGFLGVPPNFKEKRVYQSGLAKQLKYQSLRFNQMLKSPQYFNASLIDTLSGEFYRSRKKDEDYFHLYDYFKWDEQQVDKVLENYSWERSPDTSSTWRIGDGTAAFYNYIYHRVAGFTEHDTFRSNQIREGDITRNQAIEFINVENSPRYENIRWYLDALNMNFLDVIERINDIPRLGSNRN